MWLFLIESRLTVGMVRAVCGGFNRLCNAGHIKALLRVPGYDYLQFVQVTRKQVRAQAIWQPCPVENRV
jgi:hypothetical protein